MTGYDREGVVTRSKQWLLEATRYRPHPPSELHDNSAIGEESVESHDSTAHASTPTYQPEPQMPSSLPPPPTPVQQKPPLESGAESTKPMYLTYNLPTYPVRDTDGNETGLVQIKQEELRRALTRVFFDGVDLGQKTALQNMTGAGLSTGQHDYPTQGWQQQSTNLSPTASGYSLGTSSTNTNLSIPQMPVSSSDYQPDASTSQLLSPPPSAQGVPGGPNGQFSYAGQSASSATGRDPAERLL